MKCSSCGVNIGSSENWVEFGCPSCGKEKIVRCEKCRKLINTYKCKSCSFIGP